jgi:hypothetical protein
MLVSLYIYPASKDIGFTPELIFMGPRITNQGIIPDDVKVPEGSGAMVVEGKPPAQATYEPFSHEQFLLAGYYRS